MSDLNQLHSDKNTHTIGDVIRTRREELQLSLEDVSQRLRIRLVFLKALEDGRIDLLPGVVYASGFLKAYAELLQLDSGALVKKFRQEHQVNIQKPTLMFPAPVPQSGVPAGVMIFFSVLIMVVAYVGWYKMTDHQQALSNIIPPAPVQNNQNTNTLQPVSPQIASIMPAEHPSLLPQDNKPGDTNANKPIVVTNNIQPQPAQQPSMQTNTTPANPQSMALPTSSQPSTENANPKPVESKQPEQPLMLKAIAPSWLQIKDKEGHVLYQKVLKKDETWQIPNDKDEIVMTIGNPGVVVLQKGDVQSAPLGKKGRTLRRFSLNAAKADMLLKGDSSDPSSTSPSDSPAQQVRKRNKPVVSRPVSVPRHDSSADDLNAGQLNH